MLDLWPEIYKRGNVLTRIEGVGDLIALEAKYQLACLTGLRNWHRSLIRERENSKNDNTEEKKFQSRPFVELITHIENQIEDGTFCFKFAYLRQLYESRLADFGIRSEINKVRFKETSTEALSTCPRAKWWKECDTRVWTSNAANVEAGSEAWLWWRCIDFGKSCQSCALWHLLLWRVQLRCLLPRWLPTELSPSQPQVLGNHADERGWSERSRLHRFSGLSHRLTNHCVQL